MTAASVLVTVGTDHHRFDRLMRWITTWPPDEVDWFVQHGSSPCPPGVAGAPLLTGDELTDRIRSARAVVCHGGPGLIMDVRAAGHRPVVVPRQPELGEHVDGHQVQFVTWLAARADLRVATDETSFRRELRAAIADGPADAGRPGRPATVERFRALVTDLVASPRRGRSRSA